MSAKSERPKKRRIRLVGGGYRWSRESKIGATGGLKSTRRSLRRDLKDKKLTPAMRSALKTRLKEMLAVKDKRVSR